MKHFQFPVCIYFSHFCGPVHGNRRSAGCGEIPSVSGRSGMVNDRIHAHRVRAGKTTEGEPARRIYGSLPLKRIIFMAGAK